MSGRILDIDHHTGIIETFHQHNGKNVIRKHQNTNAIVDANRRELNNNVDGNWKGDMHKVASIPLIVIDMWREELKARGHSNCDPLSTENRKFLLSKLNSPDWNALRTKQGVI